MVSEQKTRNTRATIERFMTPNPCCIERSQSLSVAHDQMRAFKVRHLPVLEEGKLVGILSQRDLFFMESLRDVDPNTVPVEDAMSPDAYVVDPAKSLGEVTTRMVEHKYGSAVVVREGRVIGIFTTTDAMRALVKTVEAWL